LGNTALEVGCTCTVVRQITFTLESESSPLNSVC